MLSEGETFEVCWLVEADSTIPVLDFLEQLERVDQALAATSYDVLRRFKNPQYHRPHSKPILGIKGEKIWEVRFMGGTKRRLVRFPYIYRPGAIVVMLYGFDKGFEPSPKNFVKEAVRCRDLIINGKASYEKIPFK